MRVSAAVLLVLGACAVPRPAVVAPVPDRDLRAEAREVLGALEASFCSHWGSIEKTKDFARLGHEHVAALREEADANGSRALMALRTLARLAPGERFSLGARAILYAGALAREADFSRWGVVAPTGFLPGIYGQELLDLGTTAMPYLRPLLRDVRRAPASAERAGRLQGDRVCDYAWVFLATVFDRPLAYHADPAGRDPQIRALDLWLDRRR